MKKTMKYLPLFASLFFAGILFSVIYQHIGEISEPSLFTFMDGVESGLVLLSIWVLGYMTRFNQSQF